MNDPSRRHLLTLGGSAAVIAAAGLPPVAPAAAAGTAPVRVALTWIVGTPGEGDHEIIRAPSLEAAIRFRAEECEVIEIGDEPELYCDCGSCVARSGYEATRVQAWDGRAIESIGGGDWIEAGFDAICDRCGYEASRRDGGRSVAGVPICSDCMTLADWDIVDPETAAELRVDLEDEATASGTAAAGNGPTPERGDAL